MTTAEILRKARALLVERGWTQGCYRNSDGQMCALGAVEAATRDICRITSAEYQALLDAVGAPSVTDWNDEKGRTVDEVLAAYDRAIAAEEGP